MSLHLSDSIPENIIYPATLRRECVRSLSCMHIKAPALIPRDVPETYNHWQAIWSIPFPD